MLTESERFEAECAAKRRYGKQRAKRAAKSLMSSGGWPVRPYRCTWCQEWHVGHPAKAKWLTGMVA